MFDAVAVQGKWTVAFFVVCLVIGSYVIMDLMLAILLEKFQSEFQIRQSEKSQGLAQSSLITTKMPELRAITDLSDMEMLDPRYLTRELLHVYNDFSSNVSMMSAREMVVYNNIQAFLKGLDLSTKGNKLSNRRERRKSIGDWLGKLAVDPEDVQAVLEQEQQAQQDFDSVDEENELSKRNRDASPSSVDSEELRARDLLMHKPKLSIREQVCIMVTMHSTPRQKAKYNEDIWKGRSLFVFSVDNCLRSNIASLVHSSGFQNLILIFIIISSLLLAVEPSVKDAEVLKTLEDVDLVLNLIFLVEVVFKILALGLIGHPNAYLRKPANCLDFLLVVTSFAFAGVKSLRSVRILRPLRAIFRSPGIRNDQRRKALGGRVDCVWDSWGGVVRREVPLVQ
jgi:hypothetical protein